jgi:hypothetical protein
VYHLLVSSDTSSMLCLIVCALPSVTLYCAGMSYESQGYNAVRNCSKHIHSECAHSVNTAADLCVITILTVTAMMKNTQVSVEGKDVPSPIRSFTQAGFDDILLSEIIRQVTLTKY